MLNSITTMNPFDIKTAALKSNFYNESIRAVINFTPSQGESCVSVHKSIVTCLMLDYNTSEQIAATAASLMIAAKLGETLLELVKRLG